MKLKTVDINTADLINRYFKPGLYLIRQVSGSTTLKELDDADGFAMVDDEPVPEDHADPAPEKKTVTKPAARRPYKTKEQKVIEGYEKGWASDHIGTVYHIPRADVISLIEKLKQEGKLKERKGDTENGTV